MFHIAIMKKQWKLIPKILKGEKVVESRWFKNKIIPWNKIKPRDIIYFKNSGEKVTVKARVTKVEQYEIRNNKHALEIMKKYSQQNLGTSEIQDNIKKYIVNKNYAIFVHFDNMKKIEPFSIDKTGFGMQTAWLVTANINRLRRED